MKALVDATTLIALGQTGELDLLTCLNGELVIPIQVQAEVSTEPARTNVRRISDHTQRCEWDSPAQRNMLYSRAKEILGENTENGDVAIIASVLRTSDINRQDIGVISDDQRVRTVAQGFNATVTGTIGVIVRAVEDRGMAVEEGKSLVRRVDSHGLHMTGELREKAYKLVEEAAEDE